MTSQQPNTPDVTSELGLVLTELGQKLEPGDLSAIATAAKQDLAKAVLDAISATLTSVNLNTDTLETLLSPPLLVESATGDYTETPVTSGPAAGLPATRTYTSGPLDGLTTTWTYDDTYGTVVSRVTA